MEWRWLIGDFTDSTYSLSASQRRDVARLAHERYISRWALARYSLLYLLLPTILGFLALPKLLERFNLAGRIPSLLVTMAIVLLLVWPVSAWVYGRLYVRACRRAMGELKIPICIHCGYSHEGLDEDIIRCPECGRSREHVA